MSVNKQIDLNVISRNGQAGNNSLQAITIDCIAAVYKDNANVTTIIYDESDKVHANNTPVKYKVVETLNAITVKANAADSSNGLVTVTVTKANGSTLNTPRTEIINRVMFQSAQPIYDENFAITGTKIKYGFKRQTIIEVSENLVTDTNSSGA